MARIDILSYEEVGGELVVAERFDLIGIGVDAQPGGNRRVRQVGVINGDDGSHSRTVRPRYGEMRVVRIPGDSTACVIDSGVE